MPQSQGVSHLVHGDVLDGLHDHFLLSRRGLLGVGASQHGGRSKGQMPSQAAREHALLMQRIAGRNVLMLILFVIYRVQQRPGHGRDTLGGEGFVFRFPILNEVGIQNYVGVEDLPRIRVHSGRPHGKRRSSGNPAERVVSDILGIPRGRIFLLPHLDGVDKTRFLKGLVPFEYAIANRLAIFVRNRLL